MTKGKEDNDVQPVKSSPEVSPQALEPPPIDEEVASWIGIPKTPQGWLTFGLTVMALLIAAALLARYG